MYECGGGFPGGSAGKESACNAGDAGDAGSIPGLRRSSGGGNGNQLQYSCLENSMYRGACRAMVHGVTRSWTQLKRLSTQQTNTRRPWWLSSKESACNAGDAGDTDSILQLGRSPGGGHGNPLQYSCLEDPMEEEPGRLQSMGSLRVGHD